MTTTEAHALLNQLLVQLSEALRPDRLITDLLDALDRVETAASYAVRSELMTTTEANVYRNAADDMMRAVAVDAPAASPSPAPISLPAIEDEETAWAEALDADLNPLPLTDDELTTQLSLLTTADLTRTMRAADAILAQREAAAVAIARRANPTCPAARNLTAASLHHP